MQLGPCSVFLDPLMAHICMACQFSDGLCEVDESHDQINWRSQTFPSIHLLSSQPEPTVSLRCASVSVQEHKYQITQYTHWERIDLADKISCTVICLDSDQWPYDWIERGGEINSAPISQYIYITSALFLAKWECNF